MFSRNDVKLTEAAAKLMCPTNDGTKDTEHLFLLRPSYDMKRRDFLARLTDLLQPFVQTINLPGDPFIHLLFHGGQNLPIDLTKNIIELTLRFILETVRFK